MRLMMATGHMLTGSLFCGVVSPLIPSPLTPAAAVVVGTVVGAPLALVMDLDTKGKAYYALMPASLLLKPLLVMLAQLIFHLTRGHQDRETTGGHRMFTHQPEFAAILALAPLPWVWGTPWQWWVPAVLYVGIWAHRPGDACTKAGVPISLIRVIIRCLKGEARVWLTVGIPRWLRFATGGGQGTKMFGTKIRNPWEAKGEKVVTGLLGALVTVLLGATVVGLYPTGIGNMIERLMA